ncbi:MAG TPA: pseudouridine synthase [Bdellovibrionales bacterium]|nr:pseudouridine synthase [Bdellovibrionales bacterium]
MELLYRDGDLVAVHKPSGLLVHRSALDRAATRFAVQLTRDLIGQPVFPVHRLDRATSGVLLFALSPGAARKLAAQFEAGTVEKEYLAVVRGIPPDQMKIDYALKEPLDEKGDPLARRDKAPQDALTIAERVAAVELPYAVDKYPTARYALVRARPKTGRRHQIRRHLRHIGHPIVGDVTYGVGRHNRFFESHFGIRRLLLACTALTLAQPTTGERLMIRAPLAPELAELFKSLGWPLP